MDKPHDEVQPTLMIVPSQLRSQQSASATAHLLVPVDAPEAAIRVDALPITIGRSPECGLQLNDPGVSGRHCDVRLLKSGLYITDLGSTNGTFVDGKRAAAPTPVPVGALIHVGTVQIRHEVRDDRAIAEEVEWGAELKGAARYITDLLPAPWSAPPFELHWRLTPSRRLGGDSFGYARLVDGCVEIYLIDVCGHGLPAALHSVSILNVLRQRELPIDRTDPGAVLAHLNQAFPMERHSDVYATVWHGIVDPHRRRLRFASAGHPAVLLRAGASASLQRLQMKRPPIGMVEGIAYASAEAELPRDATLWLFSDGVFEEPRADGQPIGLEWLEQEILRSAGPIAAEPARIEEALRRATGARRFQDDFTLLVARIA
jgi:serine phosphatase RsbU (regulator of sigma subunit)